MFTGPFLAFEIIHHALVSPAMNALRFDAARMIAPQVIAKGAGHVAERIKQIAAENDVPLVEDKPLARAL